MKNFVRLLISIFLLTNIAFAFSFNVDKPSIRVATAPKRTVDGVITVENTGKTSMSFQVNVEDWKIEDNGSKGFYPAGSLANSCSNWLNVYPRTFTLKAGEKKAVNYVMTVPADAQGGHYSVVFFETLKKGLKDSSVIFAGRIGTLIYHHIEGDQIVKGSLVDATVVGNKDSLKIRTTFENRGNVYLGIKPSIALLDSNGKVVVRKRLEKYGVMPGGMLKRYEVVPMDLKEGKYYTVFTAEYGKEYGMDDFLIAESEIEIARPKVITDPKKLIKNVVIDKFTPLVTSDGFKFFVRVKNSNKYFATVRSKVSIVDRKGNTVETYDVSKGMKFSPNSIKMFTKKVNSKLAKGKYKAVAEVFVGKESVVAEKKVEIK